MSQELGAAVIAFIAAVESVTGMPIAVLDRIEEPRAFWARSAAILCEKTGDNFCEEDMRFMTSNTEPFGQSHILAYSMGGGAEKRVCAVIPPIPEVEPYSIGEAFGNDYYGGPGSLPRPAVASAWLMLYHVAHCLDAEISQAEERRAVAFATLGLGLLQGSPVFTSGQQRSEQARLAALTGMDAAWWAAGTSERILMEHWKAETSERLSSQHGCYSVVVEATTIDVESVRRDQELAQQDRCFQDYGEGGAQYAQQARITDANLWLWMYGSGGVGAPPLPWTPMKPFASMEAGASYVLSTSRSLAR